MSTDDPTSHIAFRLSHPSRRIPSLSYLFHHLIGIGETNREAYPSTRQRGELVSVRGERRCHLSALDAGGTRTHADSQKVKPISEPVPTYPSLIECFKFCYYPEYNHVIRHVPYWIHSLAGVHRVVNSLGLEDENLFRRNTAKIGNCSSCYFLLLCTPMWVSVFKGHEYQGHVSYCSFCRRGCRCSSRN